MSRYIHGGDIADTCYDFSVNTNPLGLHPAVAKAMEQALTSADKYPEYGAHTLTEKLAKVHGVTSGQLLVTAGASEAFVGICRGLGVKKGAVVDPGFFGYEYALVSVDADIIRYSFEDILSDNLQLEVGLQVLFLCNPNNPDGRLLPAKVIDRIIKEAAAWGIYIVLDECFLPLSDAWQDSFISRLSDYDNLIIVRAFTKSFALAGVRLGYLVCQNKSLIEKISRTLPEWNVSGLAIAAGLEALEHMDYLDEARKLIVTERHRLSTEIMNVGFVPYDSAANFILFKGSAGLKKKFLTKGILIRDCSNYFELPDNCYRIAVLTPEKNDYLIAVLKQLLEEK